MEMYGLVFHVNMHFQNCDNMRFQKGNIPWNKDLIGEEYRNHYPDGIKGGRPVGFKHKNETIEKIRKANLGNKNCLGREISKETRNKISDTRKKLYREEKIIILNQFIIGHRPINLPLGPKHWNWKGGLQELKRIRNSTKYRNWRKQILKRDNNICQTCNKQGSIAHHIFPMSSFPEFIFDLENGMTVCKDCHKSIHYGVLKNG